MHTNSKNVDNKKKQKNNSINDTKDEATSKLWHIFYLSQKHLLLKNIYKFGVKL
jgi:hypothetical protein